MKYLPETVGDHIFVCLKDRYGTMAAAAKALDLSTAFLSGVVNGRKQPNPKLLDLIGWERAVVYRKKENA